ncbi:MAG: hypothetical protein V3U36_02580 [Anaerolineales bacterium]
MNRYYHAVRHPVRRPQVETYLLLTLLSFALSVSLTRLFLALTGYPQLGGGVLHISHVLWGGLLLFIAAMLPLVLANRWVYRSASILAGVGIGLFIDEVGKFITQSYDYFFPPAAPIVYAFFLICVLVYLQITKPRPRNARSELYIALEMMEEVLDHDLDAHEQNEIKNRLTFVIDQGESPEFIRLAEDLLNYFNEEQIALAPSSPGRLQDLAARLLEIEIKYLDRDRLRTLLILGLGILGLISVFIPALSLINLPLTPGREPVLEPYWYIALQVVQMLTGLLLILGAGMIMKGSESKGFRVSYITLLVYLTIVDLYLFYYYQFATILAAIFQFALLLAVLHYQHSYLSEQNKDHQSIS